MGNFNAKHQRWDNWSVPNAAGKKASEMFDDFCMIQCISSPTRYSADGQTCSVLDLFVTDQPDLVHKITVTDPISDHCWTTVELNLSFPSPPKQTISYLDY